MQESSLALKELTLAYLHRASIYQRLSEGGNGQRDECLKVAEDACKDAWSYYDALRKAEESGDAQYALVMLLSELGGLEQLQQLADDWQLKGIAHPYSAHFLAMRFATLGDYDRAEYWLSALRGNGQTILTSILSCRSLIRIAKRRFNSWLTKLKVGFSKRLGQVLRKTLQSMP